MHPPFDSNDSLSDWPDCHLRVECCGTVIMPTYLLAKISGDAAFSEILPRLRCSECGRVPAPVYLCAGDHREDEAPVWSIELVPPRKRRGKQA